MYEWFMEYLENSELRKASLEEVLSFTTGLHKMPPMGLKVTSAESCQLLIMIRPHFLRSWIREYRIALATLDRFDSMDETGISLCV